MDPFHGYPDGRNHHILHVHLPMLHPLRLPLNPLVQVHIHDQIQRRENADGFYIIQTYLHRSIEVEPIIWTGSGPS